jgi:hypothetical protein
MFWSDTFSETLRKDHGLKKEENNEGKRRRYGKNANCKIEEPM